MSWEVPMTETAIAEEDVEAVIATLRSGWLTMGPKTLELEQAFCDYTGAEHAVAVSSAAAGLQIACLALEAGPGSEVIAPALSFAGTAHAGRIAGAESVLADCVGVGEPLVDPGHVGRLITERTKAIIVTHLFGYPADVAAFKATAADRGIALIEDCSQAAGARLRDGSMAGTAGACGCFSFSAETQLGVGEGGILVTDSEELAAELRKLRSHAMTSVTWDRHRGHAETYDVTRLGFNFRLDEPRATLAMARLARLDGALAELRRVARAYRESLSDIEGVEVPFPDEWVELSGHYAFPVLLADRETRDAVRESMGARGVETTSFPALTQLSAYAPKRAQDARPVAEEVADRHLALPLSPSLGDAKIEAVVSALQAAL